MKSSNQVSNAFHLCQVRHYLKLAINMNILLYLVMTSSAEYCFHGFIFEERDDYFLDTIFLSIQCYSTISYRRLYHALCNSNYRYSIPLILDLNETKMKKLFMLLL